MPPRLNAAALLGALILFGASGAGSSDVSDGTRGARARLRRRRVQSSSSEDYVVQEAFNESGDSLGYSDDDDAGWTTSNLELEPVDGDSLFVYHEDAKYYIVGDNDSLVVEFWHPFNEDIGGKDMAAVHLNVARKMVNDHRVNGEDQLSIKVVNKGWGGVGNEEICGDAWNATCPALVLAGTTHMAARYDEGDTLSLNAFMSQWAQEKGLILTDDFIKYYFYDFYYDGNWIAVPLVSDTRVLAYNKTTFEALGMEFPPGAHQEPWDWSTFVEVAKNLTEGMGQPGWYFKGSWDEELKISLMIARSWTATLYKTDEQDRKTSALGSDFITAMNETITPMLRNGWMTKDTVPIDDKFEEWLAKDPSSTELPETCCLDPDFSTNSSELWGMTIVAPATLKDIIGDEIVEAMVPDRFSFLGGSGLFVSKKASSEQQELGWELLQGMISEVVNYALVQRSPPPLESALENEIFSNDTWTVPVEQLRSSVPAQYPNGGFAEFQELESEKPFRLMWLDIAYREMSTTDAVIKANETVNNILKTVCTEDDYDHESCRSCDHDDYNFSVSSCNPRTQKQEVTFAHDPQGSECFGGTPTPDDTRIDCDHVEVTSWFGIAIITVSCLGGVLSLFAAGLVYAYRHRPVIKFSQPRFCVLFSLGVAGMCFSNLALVGENTTGSCLARTTIWGIAFDLAFGALFSKVYRVRRIVSNAPGRRVRTRRSFLPLVSVVSLAMIVDIMVLTMWSVVDDHGPDPVHVQIEVNASVEHTACASEGGPWGIVFISFKIVLIAWGCYLAWVTRKISNTLVEGREISWSIYLFAVLAVILIFIGYAGLRIEYWTVAKAFVFSLSSCTALVMVLVPKLWGAHKQQEVDVTQLMDGTTVTVTGTTGRGASSMSQDTDAGQQPPPGSWTVACSQCGTQIDASGLSRRKGVVPPPILAPRAGVMRSALVGGWQEVVAASQRAFSEGSENPRNKPSRVDVHGRKRSSSSSESPSALAKKGPQVTIATGPWGKAAMGPETRYRLPPAPSSGGSGVLRETEVGLALKLTKVERGFRRSPASSTGGTPSIGEPIGRPPSSGLSSSTRGVGLGGMHPSVEAAAARKRGGGWRGGWKRSSRDDSMISSSSPHSELDAASFSRSLQAQAAAMRAALWSSTSQSQSQSESESHYRQRPGNGNGSGRVNTAFGRKAATVQPINGPRPSPGSMRAALNAGRAAASAITVDTMSSGASTLVAGTAEAMDRTTNPMLITTAGVGSLGFPGGDGRGGAAATAAGRPPAHRVPPLRLDSVGQGDGDGHPSAFRTPPAGGGLLQPWVGGARRPARGTIVRGPWGQPQHQLQHHYQRPQVDSMATTSQVSRTSQTSIGMSSAASYSPDAGAGMMSGHRPTGTTPLSSPSAASETSGMGLDVPDHGWGEPRSDLLDEEGVVNDGKRPSAEEEEEEEEEDDGAGAAKTRKLVGTPAAGGGSLTRSVPLLWGPGAGSGGGGGQDEVTCDSPMAGAAKTRKLIHTPSSVHRYRRAQEGGARADQCFAVGVPVEVISVGGAVVAEAEAEDPPQTDTLDETRVVRVQWVQQSPGHLV